MSKPLTPHEKSAAEQKAYQAWLERQAIYHPTPEPDSRDLVSDNRRVMDILVAVVGWLPLILAIVGIAAAVVSMDKTAAAFEASVAHRDGLFGAWKYIVALSAVVMVDLALVVAEFALVRDTLRKGLHRQVWTLAGLWRAAKVRVGIEEPLDYHQMPDSSLQFYAKFLFVLVISANVFAVMNTGNINGLADINFENGLLMFTGVAGALSLRFLGRQLSHIVYDLAAERQTLMRQQLFEEWRAEMQQVWATEGPTIIAQALHDKYLQKNRLPGDAQSPYLLAAGVDEEGEPSIEAVPLASSLTASPTGWLNASPAGNGTQEAAKKR